MHVMDKPINIFIKFKPDFLEQTNNSHVCQYIFQNVFEYN